MEVAPIAEMVMETRPTWFRHIENRLVDSTVRKINQIRTAKSLEADEDLEIFFKGNIRKNLQIIELDRNMIYDRTL